MLTLVSICIMKFEILVGEEKVRVMIEEKGRRRYLKFGEFVRFGQLIDPARWHKWFNVASTDCSGVYPEVICHQ